MVVVVAAAALLVVLASKSMLFNHYRFSKLVMTIGSGKGGVDPSRYCKPSLIIMISVGGGYLYIMSVPIGFLGQTTTAFSLASFLIIIQPYVRAVVMICWAKSIVTDGSDTKRKQIY